MMTEKKRRNKIYARREWSEFQGQMSWFEANEKCKEIGMRLPTIAELQLAFRTKEFNNWTVKGKCYWTKDENDYSPNYAFAFYISSGVSYDYDKSMSLDVRFIRDQE